MTAVLTGAAIAGCSPQAPATPVVDNAAYTELQTVALTIRSANRSHRFTVEVARSPEEQRRGLMFRRSLADDRGMIFPYDAPLEVAFWMKNTLIPLDMIFIRADGTIARIAANTTPGLLQPVPAGEPVVAVLELRGGRSAELGIRPGDRVEWPG